MDENNNIKLSTDDITKIDVSTQSIVPGMDRVDKKVIIDNGNNKFRTSSIMMGYDKQNIELGDGTFASIDDIKKALVEALKKQEKGTVIVSKKGEFLNIQNLIDCVKKASGSIVVRERNNKVINQDSRNISVVSTDGREFDKGTAFLGNKGIKLESGEYINLIDFQKALSDYVFKPPEKNVESIEQEKVVRVVSKRKMAIAPILLSIAIFLMSGVRITDDIKEKIVNQVVQEQNVVQNVDYGIYQDMNDEVINNIISSLQMGDSVFVENGMEFNQNSLENGVAKTMGDEFSFENKYVGFYRITGFSIVVNGHIVDYIEDFNGLDNTSKLNDFIEKTILDNNLDLSNIQIKIHVGNNQDFTRLGWIDVTNLITADTLNNSILEEKSKELSMESGSINNFQGNYITLKNGATINIYDDNGNLLKSGSKVIGSDGNEYIIDNLELSSSIEYSEKEVQVVDKINDGKKLTWSISDCSLMAGLLPALAAVSINVNNIKNNKKAEKSPDFYDFQDDEQYEKFKKEFEKNKEKYENSSKFKKIVNNIIFGKKYQTMQKLTDDQIMQLYASINKHNGIDFVMGSSDRIDFRNGKVVILYNDGHLMDITDIVMPDVYSIGSNNDVVAEGYVKGDENVKSR